MLEQGPSHKYKAFLSYSQRADGSLAPALQSGLQRITASWRQLRAIHVYRDETDIPTTSALLPKIKEALKESEFFILLASPLAAASPWVQIEVEYWLSLNPAEKFLIVLTEGEEPGWDQAAGDFFWDKNTSLPTTLKSRFKDEPKFTDLRWARGQKKLKLREQRFYEAVADLASTLRGVDKSTLVGEDARRLRQNRRLAWSAVLALLILSLTSSATAVVAFKQRNRALNQEAIARVNAEEANKQRKAAEANAIEALKQQGIAKANEETAIANEKEAKKQEGIAKDNAAEAKHQQGIAEANAAEAKRQQGIAEDNEKRALREGRLNLAQKLATQSDVQLDSDPQRAGLWAAEAIEATQEQDGNVTSEARAAANRALATLTGTGHHGYFRESVTGVIFNKEETLVAAADWGGVIQVFDLNKHFPQSLRHVIYTDEFTSVVAFDTHNLRLITHLRSGDCGPGADIHKKTQGCGPGLVWTLGNNRKYSSAPALLPDGPFESMAASHDKLLLAAATGPEVVIYDLADPSGSRVVRRLQKNVSDAISVLKFSKDGSLLLSGSHKGWVQVWDLSSAGTTPKTQFESKHRANQLGRERSVPIEIIQIADDRSALVTASRDWSGSSTQADVAAKLWQLHDLKPVGAPRLLTHEQAITSVDFIMSDRSVVTTSLDGAVRRWSSSANDTTVPRTLVTARCDCNPSDPFKNIESAAVSPDEGLIAVATSDATVRLISLNDASKEPMDLRGHLPNFITISPSGKWIVSGGSDRSLRVWSIDKGAPGPDQSLIGNWRSQYVKSKVSKLGTTALMFTGDQIEVWDISIKDSPRRVLTLKSSLPGDSCLTCHVELSPDGKWVVVQSDSDENKSIVQAVDGSTKFTIPVRTWNRENPFSPDSTWLLVYEADGPRLYDLSRRPVTSVRLVTDGKSIFFGNPFSKSSNWLFATTFGYNKSGNIAGYLWRIEPKHRNVRRFEISDFDIGQGQLSSDGRWFAYSANAGADYLGESRFRLRVNDPPPPETLDHRELTSVRLIRLTDEAEKLEAINLYGHELKPDGLVFSPDGRWLLTSTKDILARERVTRVRLWDLRRQNFAEKPFTLPLLDRYLREAVFSPDGRYLVTIQGTDNFARLWYLDPSLDQFVDAGTLRGGIPTYNHHWEITFSPDSKRVVIATSDDSTPYLWFLDSKGSSSSARRLRAGDRDVRDVEFSLDGTKLFAWSSNARGSQLNLFNVEGSDREVTAEEIFSSDERNLVLFQLSQDARRVLILGKELRTLRIQEGETLVALLGEALGRNITWEEWVLSGHRGSYHKTFQELPVHATVLTELAQRVADGEKNAPDGIAIDELVDWTIEFDEPGLCNELAWSLTKVGNGQQSLRTVNCALKHFPNNGNYRDTRGVARALLRDTKGAIEDFKAFLQSATQDGEKIETIEERQRWIRELTAGRNPFLPKGRMPLNSHR